MVMGIKIFWTNLSPNRASQPGLFIVNVATKDVLARTLPGRSFLLSSSRLQWNWRVPSNLGVLDANNREIFFSLKYRNIYFVTDFPIDSENFSVSLGFTISHLKFLI